MLIAMVAPGAMRRGEARAVPRIGGLFRVARALRPFHGFVYPSTPRPATSETRFGAFGGALTREASPSRMKAVRIRVTGAASCAARRNDP